MLVPEAGNSSQTRVIFAERSKIIAALTPGDRVFVSCGAFAHVTLLYRRDRESKKLLFIDPLYEFWNPTINSCVSKFELLPDKNRRYLSSVSEDDIAEMLQAVITVRNAE